jgi:hypothetical protein
MSYVKLFKDYKIRASIANDGKRIYMAVETAQGRPDGKHYWESGFVSPPNFIERLVGITWQDKLEAKEKMLLREVIHQAEGNKNPELQAEITKFLNS